VQSELECEAHLLEVVELLGERRDALPQRIALVGESELGTLLGSIYIVNTFDEVYSMTQGGPGTSTTNMPYYLYEQAFQAYNIGGAAALGVITVIIVMIIATFALRLIASVFRFEEAVG